MSITTTIAAATVVHIARQVAPVVAAVQAVMEGHASQDLLTRVAALVAIPVAAVEEVVTPDLLIRPTALVAIQVAVVEEVVILVVLQMEVVRAVDPPVVVVILIMMGPAIRM